MSNVNVDWLTRHANVIVKFSLRFLATLCLPKNHSDAMNFLLRCGLLYVLFLCVLGSQAEVSKESVESAVEVLKQKVNLLKPPPVECRPYIKRLLQWYIMHLEKARGCMQCLEVPEADKKPCYKCFLHTKYTVTSTMFYLEAKTQDMMDKLLLYNMRTKTLACVDRSVYCYVGSVAVTYFLRKFLLSKHRTVWICCPDCFLSSHLLFPEYSGVFQGPIISLCMINPLTILLLGMFMKIQLTLPVSECCSLLNYMMLFSSWNPFC
ncbi:unnamed protein product [Dibothriocephalus latus]|uniref:Uncharacterized protein n=1 Tax=Dibothriocephalus latus TaxID=60516 RepID=A0A3P7NQI2_DIBLA|nr:unnamed protein product [Dibothriocephalus latus]